MQTTLADLTDINYVIFCSCLQIVLLLLSSAVSNFSSASLPGVLAFCQLQAFALLYVGYVAYAVASHTTQRAEDGLDRISSDPHAVTEELAPTTEKPGPPDKLDLWEEASRTAAAGSAALAAVVDDEEGLAEDVAEPVGAETGPAVWEYLQDLAACVCAAGALVRALYLVFSLVVLVVGLAGAIACGSPVTVGLEWESMGAVRPPGTSRVDNEALGTALLVSLSVTSEQLAAFGLGDLSGDSFVRAENQQYFRVLPPKTGLCDITWESSVGLWVGIAFSLVQLSVCVTVGTLCGRSAASADLYVFLHYAMYAWGVQYVIDRYVRMHEGATCAAADSGGRELHVYTAVFCVLVPLIALAVGCLQAPPPPETLQLPARGAGLSRRLVSALCFLFCILTVGFMYGQHVHQMGFDLVVVSYALLAGFSVVSFVRAMNL
jgi:hypothetical protein